MNDKLEGFVKNNKRAFEEKGPSAQLWDRIAAELDKKEQQKKNRLYQWMSIAAMLVVCIGAYLTYSYQQTNRSVDIADINRSYGNKEVHLASLIEEKKDSLQTYAKDNPELYNKFTTDIDRLNKDYEALKQQLQTTPNSQDIIRAMMKNLDIQLQVLNQQLMIINQVNHYKRENSI